MIILLLAFVFKDHFALATAVPFMKKVDIYNKKLLSNLL